MERGKNWHDAGDDRHDRDCADLDGTAGDATAAVSDAHGAGAMGGAGAVVTGTRVAASSDALRIVDLDDPLWGDIDPRSDDGLRMIDGGWGADVIRAGTGDGLDGAKGPDQHDAEVGADTAAEDRNIFIDVGLGGVSRHARDWEETRGAAVDLSPRYGSVAGIARATAPKTDGVVTFHDFAGVLSGRIDCRIAETIVPCFTPGTLIATQNGEVPVERLKVGDRVITRDNGIQDIRWIGSRPLSFVEIAREEYLRPIMIRAGALGRGLPERDMMLSPNHRVLVSNERTALYFDEREVLASAKHLVDSKGIGPVEPMGVTYIHFMCEQHEVVLSDGAWTESFQPGDRTLKGMGNAQRQELFELFPELKTEEGLENYAGARRILKKHEAELISKE